MDGLQMDEKNVDLGLTHVCSECSDPVDAYRKYGSCMQMYMCHQSVINQLRSECSCHSPIFQPELYSFSPFMFFSAKHSGRQDKRLTTPIVLHICFCTQVPFSRQNLRDLVPVQLKLRQVWSCVLDESSSVCSEDHSVVSYVFKLVKT